MAITLSVGFVVDDAIVVLENIVRHREMGKGRMQAAIDGSREISFTIISMTISLVAVFIPVLFMGGIVGRLLREFAVVISVAILVSGVVSLTLTPMLGSRFLRHQERRDQGRSSSGPSGSSIGSFSGYERSSALGDTRKTRHLAFSFVVRGNGVAIHQDPKGFFPTEDTGFLMASTEASEDTSFEQMLGISSRSRKSSLRIHT